MKYRKEIYERIDEERDYQDSLTKDRKKFRGEKRDKAVGAELVMMKIYLDNAFNDFTYNFGDVPALHQIRKVVALGVRCLENHGCPRREE